MSFAYNEVQYDSHPYRLSHPERLYTLARLFGLKPEHFTHARILELGCASGGNIIPVAYNFPDCEIIGIDLSDKQIEAGNRLVAALNLSNIKLLTMSILELEPSLGKFDYIICHGIYSWVPEPVRNKILNIFRDHLAPQGVAYISYNAYPGWNMVHSIREMMLFHTQNCANPQEQATQSRWFLEFLANGLKDEGSAYAEFLGHEWALLQKQPDSYLLHDHLEEVNFPAYFATFMKQANANNLDYLADAKLYTMFAGNFPEKTAKILGEISNIVRNGQYMDFIRNQRFRTILLCPNTVKINRQITTEQVETFYIHYMASPVNTNLSSMEILSDTYPLTFPGSGITLTVKSPISKIAMILLQSYNQFPILYTDFINELQAKLAEYNIHQTLEFIKHHINHELNLIRLVFGGIIDLSSQAGLYLNYCSEMPKVTRLVQEQAKLRDLITNQRHEVIRLNDFERSLVQFLDGQTTKDAIVQAVIKKIKQGALQLSTDLLDLSANEQIIAQKVHGFCEQSYSRFVNNALLVN